MRQKRPESTLRKWISLVNVGWPLFASQVQFPSLLVNLTHTHKERLADFHCGEGRKKMSQGFVNIYKMTGRKQGTTLIQQWTNIQGAAKKPTLVFIS